LYNNFLTSSNMQSLIYFYTKESNLRCHIESRGGRLTASSPLPGRTYECETLCRRGALLFFTTLGVTLLTAGYITLGGLIFSGLESRYLANQAAAAESSSPVVMNSTMLLGKEIHMSADGKVRSTLRRKDDSDTGHCLPSAKFSNRGSSRPQK
jgi:hypothetical protein